jgi:hypothetical protein
MSLSLILLASNARISVPLYAPVSEMLTELGKTNKADYRALLAVEDFGKPEKVTRTAALKAVGDLLEKLEKDRDILPFRYGMKQETSPRSGRWEDTGSGAVFGFRLNGDGYLYGLECGVGYCKLEKWSIDEPGKGRKLETIDIREWKRLKTDDIGRIILYRTRQHPQMERVLRRLRKFLLEQEDKVIRKMIV